MRRLPIRTRITVVFAVSLAGVLAAVGAFVYVRTGDDLLDAVDAGLRSRADVVAAEVRASGSAPPTDPALIEADEAFVQVADANGAIVRSDRVLGGHPLLPPATIAGLDRALVFDRTVPGIDNVVRVLAVPVKTGGRHAVILVGASLQDRRDQLLQLGVTLAIGGVAALVTISLGAWMVVGAALAPVERMREQAARISTLEPAQRLAVPDGDDELAALARTLNAMLERLEAATAREHRFVDEAGHELRTPVAVLRARLELALSAERSPAELREVLSRALGDAEHLSRLADDLLVLTRADRGRLPIHREDVDVRALLEAAIADHATRVERPQPTIELSAPATTVRVDPVRVRQVVDNLLDNATRHGASATRICLEASVTPEVLEIGVTDDGGGFADGVLDSAFDAFTRGPGVDPSAGSGLGLAIVRTVAEAHGGSAAASNAAGGARVVVTFRAE
jgi:signal transduction histidine kinase